MMANGTKREAVTRRLLACALACVLACSGVVAPAGVAAAFAGEGSAATTTASEASAPAGEAGDDPAAAAPDAEGEPAAAAPDAPAASEDDASESGNPSGEAGAPSEGSDASVDDAASDTSAQPAADDDSGMAASGEMPETPKTSDASAAGEGAATGAAGDASAVTEKEASERAGNGASSSQRRNARVATADGALMLAALDDTRSIRSVELSYLPVLEPGDEGYDPATAAQFITYDPTDAEAPVPTIAKRDGTMRFKARITWNDGTVEEAADAKADLTWTIQEFRDEDDKPVKQLLARMETQKDGEKVLRAAGCGNGYAVVCCASNAYPDFAGATIKVAIADNEIRIEEPPAPDAPENPDNPDLAPVEPAEPDEAAVEAVKQSVTVKSVTTVFLNDAKEWVPVTSSAYPSIGTMQGETTLDALITFEDGSTARASERGIHCHWKLSHCTDTAGARIRTALVKVSAIGTVYALGVGNGSAYVDATVCGVAAETQARVGIAANGEVDPSPKSLSLRYTDVWHSAQTAYIPGLSEPEIVAEGGSVKLSPYVTYDTGSTTAPVYNSATRTWDPALSFSIQRSVDLDGNPLSQAIATVTADGTLRATGKGNGRVTVRCMLADTGIFADATVVVRGNDGSVYVTDVSILDPDGNSVGDDSIDVAKVGNLVQLFVRVSYSDHTTKTTFFGNKIDGVKWYNLRTATSTPATGAPELYSEITSDGLFRAKAGFLRSWVYVVVEKGSFYGKDVWDRVQIFDGDETDRVGSSSMVKVRVYEESEYRKFGDEATLAAEMDLTSAQIQEAGSYSDWFTFRSRGGGWGTVYASGISIPGLLSILGVESNDLRFMQFSDEAGYTGDSGFYSASVILGSRYRYSNYYMHAISSSGSYLGQQSVMPMLATATYFDYGNDPNGSGYGKMGTDGTIRLIMGMTGVEDGNARRMVRCVSNIKLVIADQPDKEDPEKIEEEDVPEKEPPTVRYGDGTGGGSGGGTGAGIGTGSGTGVGAGTKGGSGSQGGIATEGYDGGDGMGGGGSGGALDPTMRIRELIANEDTPLLLDQRDNPYRALTLVVAVAALVMSLFGSAMKFKRQKALGERMKVHGDI